MSVYNYVDESASQKQQTMSLRTYMRNIPSQPLQPYLDARPVTTKYTVLPIIDTRQPVKTPLIQQATYTPERIYNPGNYSGPWSGFASNVNHESELRNQIYPLQSCSQAVYVPSSKSNLYQVKWENNYKQIQPFSELFKNETFSPSNPNCHPDKVGSAMFNNATRQQIKEIKD